MNSKVQDKNKITLGNLITEYLDDCEYGKRLRKATIKSYKEVLNNFARIMVEVKYLDDLHPSAITEFFKRVSLRMKEDKKEVKNSTIYTYYQKMKAFIKWLEHRNYLKDDTFTHRITKPQLPKYEDDKALKEEEVSKIISAILFHNLDNDYRLKRDLLIINLLLYTGIRKGELLGIRVKDINLYDRVLYIKGETSKSKKGRSIPLHFTLCSQLKSYLELRKKKHWNNPMLITSSKHNNALTEHGLKHWVSSYKKLSGINFHLHRFRHTFACSLAKQNTDIISIMNVLGHSSTRMTERYLRSIKTENARNQIDMLSF